MLFCISCEEDLDQFLPQGVDTPTDPSEGPDLDALKVDFTAQYQRADESFEAIDLTAGTPYVVLPEQEQNVIFTNTSTGEAAEYVWTVTQKDKAGKAVGEPIEVQGEHFAYNFVEWGLYDVELTAARNTDETTASKKYTDVIEVTLPQLKAAFTSDKEEVSDRITVFIDEPILFTDATEGQADSWEWHFGNNANPTTSEARSATVSYGSVGLKQVTLRVKRSFDGADDFITKEGYVNVTAEPMKILEGWIDDKTVTLKYDEELMADPSDAMQDFSAQILTADGEVLEAVIASISTAGDVLTLELDQQTYHNEIIQISYNNHLRFTNADGTKIAPKMTNFGVMDINNFLVQDGFDPNFATTSTSDYGVWNNYFPAYEFEMSEDKYLSGGQSAYIVVDPDGGGTQGVGMGMRPNASISGINTAENYIFGMWVYVVEADKEVQGSFWWTQPPLWTAQNFNSKIPKDDFGKWVFIQTNEMPNNGETNRINLRMNGTAGTWYLDHMVMYSASDYKKRP